MSRSFKYLLAFLVALSFAWSPYAYGAGTPTTVSALMEVLKENKQKAVYDINLNAPFNKDDSGVRETVNNETGEVIVTNTVFSLPGRNGMDVELNLEYRSRDAKAYAEGTKSAAATNSYGKNVIAFYDVFDTNGYWLKTGGFIYPAGTSILATTTVDGQNWIFTGQLQYEDGTPLFTAGGIANNANQKSVDQAAKYIFGEGWSLDLPSLDVDASNTDNPNVYVNLPSGQTYKADFKGGVGLEKYELTDIVFTKDTTYANGTDKSAYKLYYAGGDSYYFSATGQLIAERDKYKNTITYCYDTIKGLKLLTKVADSVGRAIDIQYNDSVTVFKSGKRSVKLVKTELPGAPGHFYLSSFIDAQGREFKYDYTIDQATFDQLGKTSVPNTYANLAQITYPTGTKTSYIWTKSKKGLDSGYMEYFRVKERKDIEDGKTYNLLKYQYYNEPDGYPVYKPDSINELYKYYTVVIDSKGLKTKNLYNAKHLVINQQQAATRLLAETITKYHPKYNLPTKTTTKNYNTKGSLFEKVDLYDYDHRGNLLWENHPETPDKANTDDHKTTYAYDYEYNQLTSKKFKQDKNTSIEIRYTLTADQKSPASESVLGNGKLLTQRELSYDAYGNLIAEKVEQQPGQWVTTKYQYDKAYKGAYPTAVIREGIKDADGYTKTIRIASAYDFATGNKISDTDGNGNIITYEYDSLGRIIKGTNPDKTNKKYIYDDLANKLEVTNANGNKLVYYFDGLGNLNSVIEPVSNTILVKQTYDENENLIEEKDANKNIKKIAYDELARLTRVQRQDNMGKVMADTKIGYDEAFTQPYNPTLFRVTVTEKGEGSDRVNNYYFDTYQQLLKLGRLNKGKEEFSRFKYDYLGKQTEAVDYAGQKSISQYDALGRVVNEIDAQGSKTTYKYDRLSNMIAATDALGQTVNFEYDSLGRVVMEKAPFEKGKVSVTKKYYDNNGNLIKTIDPDGYVSKQYFNERNLLTAAEKVINGSKSNITKFNYDKEGNTTKVVRGLNSFNDADYISYTYSYDALNRLIMMADAANKKTYYEYDDNGNLIRLTDRNNVTTTYEYDGLNRLVEKHNSKDGSKNAIKMTYDMLGNTRKMVDASGTTKFDYDPLGRLTQIDYGNGIRQNNTYDNADRVANMKIMQGTVNQINLGYSYDKVGRLTKVNDNGKWFQYKYNQIGQLTEELNGVTGIKSAYQYYPSGNVKNLRHFNGQDIVSGYEYKYDKRGNQVEKNEGEGTTKYYYDALSRIKTAVMPEGAIQNYEYDDLDNISKLAKIQGNRIEETSYTYDKNSRLLLQETENGSEIKQNRFSYDLNGNQLTKDEVIKRNGNTVASKSTQFWYDGFNQLSRVKDPNGQFIAYTYNGSGLRTKKESGDKATNYIYDGGANIIMETDQDNKVTAKNIRGTKLLYRESYAKSLSDPAFLYYLHNAHGDVTQLLNEQGEVIKDYRYDPFGEEQSVESLAFGGKQSTELWRQEIETIDNPFKYAGEYQDEETGNYYLRARYYDPTTQRFINEDSYGVEKGAGWSEHLYGYGNNNPLKYMDPTGHTSQIRVGKTYLSIDQNGMKIDAARFANALGFGVEYKEKSKNYVIWLPNGKGYEYTAQDHNIYNLINEWGLFGAVTVSRTDMWGNTYPIYGNDFDKNTNVTSCHTGGNPVDPQRYWAVNNTGGFILESALWDGMAFRLGSLFSKGANKVFKSGINALKRFDIKDAYIKPKHLSTTGGGFAKFLGDTKTEAEAMLRDVMKNGKVQNVLDNGLTKQGNKSYEIIIDAGKKVGTRGETAVKIVISEDGGMLSAYPIK